MFRIRRKVGFPRKVVAYYLLFCLVTVCWLTFGVIVSSHTSLDTRTTNSSLGRLNKARAAIEIAFLRQGEKALAEVLQRIKSETGLVYAAIVSPNGSYLSHTNPSLIGQPADKHSGRRLNWGSITGTQYVDEHGHNLKEFQTPLTANGESLGMLQIAFPAPTLIEIVLETVNMAPLTLLAPLLLIVVGAYVLTKLTNPVNTVYSQLQHIGTQPPASTIQINPIRAKDSASMGWNRLADFLVRSKKESGSEDLNSRLSEAIAARKQSVHAEILQNLSEGIVATDMEGRITFANRAILTLLNSDEELEKFDGINLQKYLSENVSEVGVQELSDPQTLRRTTVSELSPEDGRAGRTIRVARQPLQNSTQKGHVWSIRDITQQKLAESMRDQFIDTATHELRTPLSNIKAYAETLVSVEEIDIEQQKEFCNIINSEVTRLARFVDDLLSLSSMEVGSISIEKQDVDIARMFEEVVDKVQPLLQHKQIAFEVRLPAKMGTVQLDKDKIVAVLVNLLGNAAKYTPHGNHVALKVSIDESHLNIAVEDTGVGIAAEEIPHVFDKFFRSEDPRVQEESGTGLGLSLAREVVRMHGGEIAVESELNQGSTFHVILPLE